MTQSWIGKNKWNYLTAPREFVRARLEYADNLLLRAKREYGHQQIKILMNIYAPIIEKIKRNLERRHGYERRDDIEDAVSAEFMHMLQMYDDSRRIHLKFPNFLKSYFEGWCQRHLTQMTTGTKKGLKFFNSSSFDDDQSHLDVASGLRILPVDNEASVDVKDMIKAGLDTVRKKMGERAVDALLMSCLYDYTHNEISELLGCTQARVSQMLADAKKYCVQRIQSEEEDA